MKEISFLSIVDVFVIYVLRGWYARSGWGGGGTPARAGWDTPTRTGMGYPSKPGQDGVPPCQDRNGVPSPRPAAGQAMDCVLRSVRLLRFPAGELFVFKSFSVRHSLIQTTF